MDTTRYTVNPQTCTCCAGCSSVCPVMAIRVENDLVEITSSCIACGNCKAFCPTGAITRETDT